MERRKFNRGKSRQERAIERALHRANTPAQRGEIIAIASRYTQI